MFPSVAVELQSNKLTELREESFGYLMRDIKTLYLEGKVADTYYVSACSLVYVSACSLAVSQASDLALLVGYVA